MKNLLTHILDQMTEKEQSQSLELADVTGWSFAERHFQQQNFKARNFATAETYYTKIVEPAWVHKEIDDETLVYWREKCHLNKGYIDPRITIFVHSWNNYIRKKLTDAVPLAAPANQPVAGRQKPIQP